MDHLFNRMDGMYLGKWRKEFLSEQAVENWREAWAEAFAEEGIAFDEIKRGIVACRRLYDWAPSLPEFLKACRPALDYEAAYQEAMRQLPMRAYFIERGGEMVGADSWTHPAIYWAAMSIKHELDNYSYPQIKARWKAALDAALSNPRGEVPVARPVLPPPGKASMSREDAEAHLAKMRGSLMDRMRVSLAKTLLNWPSESALAERQQREQAEAELAQMRRRA